MVKPKESEINQFVQLNSGFYLEQWNKIEDKQTKNIWHWRAFLFAPVWLCARKMYFNTLIYALIFIILLIIAEVLNIPVSLPIVIFVLSFHTWAGLRGNLVYRNFTYHRIQEIKETVGGKDERIKRLNKCGGISFAGAIIAIIFVIILFNSAPDFISQYIYWMDYDSRFYF